MVIQYFRLSSVCREIFRCANMPTEVSFIDLTPEQLGRWGASIAHSNAQSGGCMWPHTALEGTPNNSDLHTQKRGSRLWQITVLTWGRFPSEPVLFYRSQGHVGAFKHYCISWYIQESALFSRYAACALWHRSELLKALPCPLSGPLHVWYPLPRQFLSLQFTSPSQKGVFSSSWRLSLGCLRPLTVFYFQRLILQEKKIFTVARDSCTQHERSSSLSAKITPIFLIKSMQIKDVTMLFTSVEKGWLF